MDTLMPAFVNTAPTAASTFPALRDDAGLTAGSLMLIEPGHPKSTLVGTPIDGQVIENLAYREALSLLGLTLGDRDDVDATFTIAAGWNGTTTGKLDRTTKGGLHGGVSQTVDTTTTSARFEFPVAIKQYVADHLAIFTDPAESSIAMSLWRRPTRAGVNSGLQPVLMGIFKTSNGAVGGIVQTAGGSPTSGQAFVGRRAYPDFCPVDTPALRILAVARWAVSITPPITGADISAGVAFGGFPPYNSASHIHKAESFVLYRAHMVDLTAAGMTYGQFEAQEMSLFNAAFAEGGRYYNDGGFPALPA